MLADSSDDVGEARLELGEASLEYKLDGARIEVHKAGGAVRVFSRALRDVTAAVPEAVLAWQTTKLLDLEMARDQHTVYVRPELVVEIAFNEIQASRQYPGRLALRFARVKRHRPDKSGNEVDTFRSVQRVYRQTTGLEPPPRL